jgi:hypothetical protein
MTKYYTYDITLGTSTKEFKEGLEGMEKDIALWKSFFVPGIYLGDYVS